MMMFNDDDLIAFALELVPEAERAPIEKYIAENEAAQQVVSTAWRTSMMMEQARPPGVFIPTRALQTAGLVSVLVIGLGVGGYFLRATKPPEKEAGPSVVQKSTPNVRPAPASAALSPEVKADTILTQAELDSRRASAVRSASDLTGDPLKSNPIYAPPTEPSRTKSGVSLSGVTQGPNPLSSAEQRIGVAKSKREGLVSGRGNVREDEPEPRAGPGLLNEPFPLFKDNPFVTVEGVDAASTFGLEVDTTSYQIIRQIVRKGDIPPPQVIRLEEMLHHFPTQDPAPKPGDPFAVQVELTDCPWEPRHRLARVHFRTRPISPATRPVSNLVFLIDVSVSMNDPQKMPVILSALHKIVEEMKDEDRLAVVIYGGGNGTFLESTPGTERIRITDTLNRMITGGTIQAEANIQRAYAIAREQFLPGANNRVVICTDGNWAVGADSPAALKTLVEDNARKGVALSIIGVQMPNPQDDLMHDLVRRGQGVAHTVREFQDTHAAFLKELGGEFATVARNVRLRVEFNPARVGYYRKLGFDEKPNDPADTAGGPNAHEIYTGHAVAALYELEPRTEPLDEFEALPGFRYQDKTDRKPDARELLTVTVRYQPAAFPMPIVREWIVPDAPKPFAEASGDVRFSAAVAGYALILRDSRFRGTATFDTVLEQARAASGWDPGGYRKEFIELVAKTKSILENPKKPAGRKSPARP